MTQSDPNSNENTSISSILGVSTDALQQVSVAELCEDPIAIRMVLHYYRQLQNENVAQKTEINTLKIYVDAFNKKKQNTLVGGPVLLVSNLVCAVSINILTACATTTPSLPVIFTIIGVGLLVVGLALAVLGGWLTTWKDS